jgi:hypothetical protein
MLPAKIFDPFFRVPVTYINGEDLDFIRNVTFKQFIEKRDLSCAVWSPCSPEKKQHRLGADNAFYVECFAVNGFAGKGNQFISGLDR